MRGNGPFRRSIRRSPATALLARLRDALGGLGLDLVDALQELRRLGGERGPALGVDARGLALDDGVRAVEATGRGRGVGVVLQHLQLGSHRCLLGNG